MDLKRIILLGAPGSGKGTQARFIEEDFDLEHISVGEILREEMRNSTVTGLKIADAMNKGQLISDDVIEEIMANKLSTLDAYLLDGFPRTLEQAKMLEELLESRSQEIDIVVYLAVSREEVVRRISGRRFCAECGALFHIIANPPKQEDICDVCSKELSIREDDNEETANKRMDVYLELTAPLIDFYKQKSKLLEIDGNNDIDIITKNIKDALAK